MKEVDLFTLITKNQEESVLAAVDGEASVNLKGSVLEKQLSLSNGWYLVLTTANSPYDEVLYATLLHQKLKLLDQVELSDDLTPGVLEDVQSSDENCLRFSFNRETPYTLNVDTNGFTARRPGGKGKRAISNIFKKKYLHIN